MTNEIEDELASGRRGLISECNRIKNFLWRLMASNTRLYFAVILFGLGATEPALSGEELSTYTYFNTVPPTTYKSSGFLIPLGHGGTSHLLVGVVQMQETAPEIWQWSLPVTKLDSMGRITAEYLHLMDYGYRLRDVCKTDDGGAMIMGECTGTDQLMVINLTRLDSELNIVWTKTYGANDHVYAGRIASTPDGGYILGCSTNAGIGGDKSEVCYGLSDFWLIKVTIV